MIEREEMEGGGGSKIRGTQDQFSPFNYPYTVRR